MKDGLETERKWVLGMLPDRYNLYTAFTIMQLYGKDLSGPFRIRMQYGEDCPIKYFLTRKTYVSVGVSREIEGEISRHEFDERLKECNSKLTKTRFLYKHGDLLFEVDVYDRLSLITMEVELDYIEQEIDIPDYIMQCIITEVTGNDDFNNYSLSKLFGEHKYAKL